LYASHWYHAFSATSKALTWPEGDHLKEFVEFIQRLNRVPRLHRVPTVHFAPRASHPGSIIEAADHFVGSLGYSTLGESWLRLKKAEAQRVLATHLQTSLAYGVPMLSHAESGSLSAQFVAAFDGDATFLSNWSNGEWSPLTSSTFEAAYVGIDDMRIALLLFEDED
jgi:hypothetical protein